MENLPKGLKYLYCDDNYLQDLDNLPLTLIKLDCHGNSIEYLDNLPIGLKNLINQINKNPKNDLNIIKKLILE